MHVYQRTYTPIPKKSAIGQYQPNGCKNQKHLKTICVSSVTIIYTLYMYTVNAAHMKKIQVETITKPWNIHTWPVSSPLPVEESQSKEFWGSNWTEDVLLCSYPGAGWGWQNWGTGFHKTWTGSATMCSPHSCGSLSGGWHCGSALGLMRHRSGTNALSRFACSSPQAERLSSLSTHHRKRWKDKYQHAQLKIHTHKYKCAHNEMQHTTHTHIKETRKHWEAKHIT